MDITEDEISLGAWSTFRSEPMRLIRICLPTDDTVAISTIRALASAQIAQIVDGNADVPITQRRYKQEVASCIECTRLLRVLEEEVVAAHEEESGLFERNDEDVGFGVVYTDLEQPLEKLLAWYGEVDQFNVVLSDIIRRRNSQVEMREVLLRSGDFLALAEAEASPRSIGAAVHGVGAEMSDLSAGLLDGQDVESQSDEGTQLQSLSGVVLTAQTENFARALFRAMRGLVITQFQQIEDTITDPATGKAMLRIKRIADGFAAHLYDVPADRVSRAQLIQECEANIDDIATVVDKTKKGKLQVLRAFYQQVMPIKSFVKRELVVYRTLNMFEQSPSGTLLVADCWIPAYASNIVRDALEKGKPYNSTDSSLVAFMEEDLPQDGILMKPTFIRMNRFTAPFQGIVNTYGIPRYREINPGFFALGMFPFLFGIMFGDIVHGALLLLFAAYLIMFEDTYANHDLGEIFQMVYGARYLLLIMGVCAFYMGFIYNEALSVAVDLLDHSAYGHSGSGPSFPDRPYIFGVDSVWRHSNNMIQYTNSLKMKMSIIIGVGQMTFGIFLKLFNNIHFGRYVEAMVESIPEILFMSLTFGYMSALIFLKWSIDYSPPPPCFASGCEGVIRDGHQLKAAPPSIIQIMIGMFKMQPLEPELAMYAGQESFQKFMLIIAVAALPVLLFGKPLYLKRKMDMEAAEAQDDAHYSALPDDEPAKRSADEEEHNFGDIVVHQGIHTVEFALGCVSNTASYLRLWALSLAHSQLSEVFWEYILFGYEFSLFGYNPGVAGGWMTLIPCYFIFFCVTIGILMMMESLSAFLHALRLQWVEFQTKFYAADGFEFVPLSFEEGAD